ncbi:MAG: MBL fold metallo-hydrolase [Candidatus Eisenbacteria bacterium]|nr:MBL fold metallo-hydrolase [Candidatus Eisenbacteria bacterium]
MFFEILQHGAKLLAAFDVPVHQPQALYAPGRIVRAGRLAPLHAPQTSFDGRRVLLPERRPPEGAHRRITRHLAQYLLIGCVGGRFSPLKLDVGVLGWEHGLSMGLADNTPGKHRRGVATASNPERRRPFRLRILASGSSGNAALLQAGGPVFLLDAGISARSLQGFLQEDGFTWDDVRGVFLSHEHDDHVRGLPVLTRRCSAPLCGTAPTLRALEARVGAPARDRAVALAMGEAAQLSGVTAVPLRLPHDAAGPVGYRISCQDRHLVHLTDLGYVSRDLCATALEADVLVLEANHDERMLQTGPYPHRLKRRVSGPYGHISNSQMAEALRSLLSRSAHPPHTVVLAHLSRQNNTPQLALESARNALAHLGLTRTIRLEVAHSRTPLDWIDFEQ